MHFWFSCELSLELQQMSKCTSLHSITARFPPESVMLHLQHQKGIVSHVWIQMLPKQMYCAFLHDLCSVIKMICEERWTISEGFPNTYKQSKSVQGHISPESPPCWNFPLLKCAVHHYKVTDLGIVDGELGVERKCKIQLYLSRLKFLTPGFSGRYTLRKISWELQGHVSQWWCPYTWLLRANLSSAVKASTLSSAPWWPGSLL